MSCEIRYLDNGKVAVKKHKGLFEQILKYNEGDVEASVSMYGYLFEDEFLEMGIKKPTLDNLLSYIDVVNTEEAGILSKGDRVFLQDMLLTNRSADNVKERFIDAFTVDGKFGINEDTLLNSGLFTQADVDGIINEQNIGKIRSIYYKLINSNEELVQVQTPFKITNEDGTGRVNPDKYEQYVYDNYIGLETRDQIFDKALELEDSVVLDNPELVDDILRMIDNKTNLVVYEVSPRTKNIVPKEVNNHLSSAWYTVSLSDDHSPLKRQIETLINLPLDTYANDFDVVQKYVKNVEKQAAELGFDLQGLSEVIGNRSYSDVQNYLMAWDNYLTDVVEYDIDSLRDSFEELENIHKEFYDLKDIVEKQTVDNVVNSEGSYMIVESRMSEALLFSRHGLVRHRDNIYSKVDNNRELSDLIDDIVSNDLVQGDVENFIRQYARQHLGQHSDTELLQKMIAYKILNNSDLNRKDFEVVSPFQDETNMFTYLFNKQIIKNQFLRDLFYINGNGLQVKHPIGDYTLNRLRIELGKKTFEELVEYSKYSKNNMLKPLSEIYTGEVNEVETRKFVYENPELIQELDTHYVMDNNVVIVEGVKDKFVKVNGEIYEFNEPTIYAKLEDDGGVVKRSNVSSDRLPNVDSGIKIDKTEIKDDLVKICK